jgi:hypothetical protein
MKLLKRTDLVIQFILFTIGFLGFTLFSNAFPFIYFYFFLGGWQLLSLGVHALQSKNLFFRKERLQYAKSVLGLVIIGIFSGVLAIWAAAPLLLYLFALLVISPGLAIWYFTICFREIQLMNNKELIHLK